MRFSPWLLSALLAVVSTAPAAFARASGLMLGYEAPRECPNREYFWEQLWARSARLQSMKPGELAITVNARIAGVDSRYVGHLLLVDSVGAVVQREVSGSTCWDVIAALTLIAAVSLDSLPAQWQPTLPVPPRQKEKPKRYAVGPVFGIHEGVAPQVVPVLGLSATYHDRRRFGSPEFRFEALVAWSKSRPVSEVEGATARFLWMSSRSTACPFQVNLASTTLGPCALVEFGRLQGTGTIHGERSSKNGWWFAPGALLNWSLQADPFWVRVAGGAVLPVIQDAFKFDPKPEIFQADGLGAIAEFELAWAF